MTLREIIASLDKSEKNEDNVDIELVAVEFNIHKYFRQEEKSKLKCYFITNWYCTDTWVGLRAYFLDDKFVATSFQSGRKMGEDFEWVSFETYAETRKYIMSLIEEDEIPFIKPMDMDTDLGDGYHVQYGSQLLTDKVILKSTGEKVTIIKKWTDYTLPTKRWSEIKIKKNDGSELIVSTSEVDVPFKLAKA